MVGPQLREFLLQFSSVLARSRTSWRRAFWDRDLVDPPGSEVMPELNHGCPSRGIPAPQNAPLTLECCYRHGLSWDDAKEQIQEFLHQRGVPHQGIVRQLALAKPLLQAWLD